MIAEVNIQESPFSGEDEAKTYYKLRFKSSASSLSVGPEYVREGQTVQVVKVDIVTKQELFALRTEIDKILLGIK